MEIAVWVEEIMDKKGSGRETAMLVKGMIQQHCWENGKSQENPWSLSGLVLRCRAGMGSLCGTLQETQ